MKKPRQVYMVEFKELGYVPGGFESYLITSAGYSVLAIMLLLPVAILLWALGQKKVMRHA